MSRALPLFPLDIVLFPGARAALHIFEPRYQALLADVLADDQEFGLLPPGDDGGDPPVTTMGCVARIDAHHPLPDGRAHVVVVGVRRFRLAGIVEGEAAPYPVGLVDEFDDERAEQLPADAVETLRRLADRCRAALSELTGVTDDTRWPDDSAELTFRIASVLPWDTEHARRLLAIRSATARADMLLAVLPQLVPELETRAAVHARAPTNGKGRHDPELTS